MTDEPPDQPDETEAPDVEELEADEPDADELEADELEADEPTAEQLEAPAAAAPPPAAQVDPGPLWPWIGQGLAGIALIVVGILLLMLKEVGLSSGVDDALGPAGFIVASLLFLGGVAFMAGAFRRTPAEQGTLGSGALATAALGLVASGYAVVLLPTLSLKLTGVSLETTPMFGFAMLFLGLLLAVVALTLDPAPEGHIIEEPSTILGQAHEILFRSWSILDKEAAMDREAAGEERDWGPATALLVGAVALSMMEYFGNRGQMMQIVNHFAPAEVETGLFAMIRDSQFQELLGYAWWSAWRVLGFFLIPCFVIRVILGERISAHGLRTRDFTKHAWIYALGFALVLPLVIGVSFGEAFSSYYPFYDQASRSWFDFFAWEVLYAAQFFSLEFFFRGFWLKACKRSMGSHAIFAMVVPYCMIHFGKPYPETLGAIVAGVLLGTLAMRTRSIWAGFLIHVTVAVTMDTASLLQNEAGLPTTWWPPI